MGHRVIIGLFQSLSYRLQHQLLHDVVGVGVGVAAVGAVFLGEGASLVGEGDVVIDINDAVGVGVGFQSLVDVDDGLGGVLDIGIPHKAGTGRDGADDGNDAVGAGQSAHRHDIVDHLVRFHPVGVVRHIVGASHDDHRLGMEVDDISGETQQHLCRRLSADSPATIVMLTEEVGVEEYPIFSDGIAHKHHFRELATRNNALVVCLKAVESEPVIL